MADEGGAGAVFEGVFRNDVLLLGGLDPLGSAGFAASRFGGAFSTGFLASVFGAGGGGSGFFVCGGAGVGGAGAMAFAPPFRRPENATIFTPGTMRGIGCKAAKVRARPSTTACPSPETRYGVRDITCRTNPHDRHRS